MWARRGGSVHVDGVEDPFGELLELGGRGLRLLLQPLVVLPEPLDLSLEPQLLLTLLGRGREKRRGTQSFASSSKIRALQATNRSEISDGELAVMQTGAAEGPHMSRSHVWETRGNKDPGPNADNFRLRGLK